MSYSILSPYEDPPFNARAVRPFECLSGGWQVIKDQYFLFMGMFLIIVVLVTCIPFTGIIYGAWMIGILPRLAWDACVASRLRSMRFGKGFGYFSQAFVIALLNGLPFAPPSIGVKVMEMRDDQIEKTYPGETPVPD